MRKITIYMWGYWGWGPAAAELVKAVDSVERKRGFKPPVFVDIRMKRSARPKSFQGNGFGRVVGDARYEIMSSLGNEVYLEAKKRRLKKSNRSIVIHDPAAAEALLDRAVALSSQKRHIVYFCACEFPHGNVNSEGEIYPCHRRTVSQLLIKYAQIKQIPLEVIEWPGGSCKRFKTQVSTDIINMVRSGRKFVPIPNPRPLSKWAEVPWGSLATLACRDDEIMILTGPAKFKQETWSLPVLHWGETQDKTRLKTKSDRWRNKHGMEASCS